MTKFWEFVKSDKFRLYFYSVCVAVMGLLVYYGIVEAEAVPYWLTLLGAIGMVGNATAAANLGSQIRQKGGEG
ncbi:holin [Mycobacterium phage Muddy]|uniref:Holin n=2 Tax=Mycobacterium phage Muddy TaxID=1340829 RepID=A0ACD4QCT2_9CAUD|nr:holin [Mycobacterium phage Muddy]WEV84072.1 holin [Mycobacterium phage Muddy]